MLVCFLLWFNYLLYKGQHEALSFFKKCDIKDFKNKSIKELKMLSSTLFSSSQLIYEFNFELLKLPIQLYCCYWASKVKDKR